MAVAPIRCRASRALNPAFLLRRHCQVCENRVYDRPVALPVSRYVTPMAKRPAPALRRQQRVFNAYLPNASTDTTRDVGYSPESPDE